MRSDRDTAETAPVTSESTRATTLVAQVNSDSTELRPGDVLRERFVIERLLGEGGMGQVFLAVDREAEATNPHVALKMLGESFKQHPQSLKALRREASQSQRMNHPNIVNVFFFERTEEHVFMVMEYMQGRSLDKYIAAYPQGAKPHEVWPIVDGMCQGLIYIHQQKVIHSDFKPSNVFVTETGEVKVLDLGIARSLDESNVQQGTTRFDPDALGALTPSYASCEMFDGMTPNEQDDLYALACVTYELLTGVHPYQKRAAIEARAESMEVVRPRGLKGRQWRALKAALGFNRADRMSSVADFYAEFAPQQSGSGKVAWSAAAASVVVAAAVGTFAVLREDDSDDRFLRATLEQSPPGESLVESSVAQEWLEQGKFFLSMGVESLAAGAVDRATIQLLTAPSSAMQSYRLVLDRSDDGSARDQAVQGMLLIANAYKTTAAAMVESNAESAVIAKTICTGLDVNRYDTDMLEILGDLTQQARSTVLNAPECRRLVNAGKVVI